MCEGIVGTPINKLVIIIAGEEGPQVFEQRTEDHIVGLAKAIEYYWNQEPF